MRNTTLACSLATLSAGILASSGGLAQVTFTGAVSNTWGVAGNWSGGVLPDASTDVRVDAAAGERTVTVASAALARSLVVDAGDRVLLANGGSLVIAADSVVDGRLNLASTGAFTDLAFSGLVVVSGTGSMSTTTTGGTNRIYGSGTGAGLTLRVPYSGAGSLGLNSLALTNESTIAAVGGTLTIDASSGGLLNRGTLRAQTSTLRLASSDIVQEGEGAILADAGRTVQFASVSVTGGRIGGAGSLVVDGSASFRGVAIDVGSTFSVPNGTTLTAHDTTTLDGIMVLTSSGAFTDLVVPVLGTTLAGTGTLRLAGSNTSTNRVTGTSGSSTFLLGEGVTLEGAGLLGNNTLQLDLRGPVRASGGTLAIDPDSRGADVATALRATPGGTLELRGGSYRLAGADRPTGSLTADTAGATLRLETGTTVTGGSVAIADGAFLRFHGTSLVDTTVALSPGADADVVEGTLTLGTGAVVDVAAGSTFDLLNGGALSLVPASVLRVDGTLTSRSSGAFTTVTLAEAGDTTVVGSGTWVLGSRSTDRVIGATGSRLVLDGPAMRGTGTLGSNSLGLVVRAGSSVTADVSGGTIEIDPSSLGVTNEGLLEAKGGATLRLTGGSIANAGTIRATDATVALSAVTITGGQLVSTGTGRFRLEAAASLFDLALVDGSRVEVPNGNSLTLGGTIGGASVLALTASGAFTELVFSSDTVIPDAEIAMTGASTNRIRGTSGVTFTHAGLLRGLGSLGNNQLVLDLRDTVRAEGGELIIDPFGTATIRGVATAASGARLTLASGEFELGAADDLPAGTVVAPEGAVVGIDSATVRDGAVNVHGGGRLELRSGTIAGSELFVAPEGLVRAVSGTSVLDADLLLSTRATVELTNGTILALEPTGTHGIGGTIALLSSGAFTDLQVRAGADVVLSGSGEIRMGNAGTNRVTGPAGARLVLDGVSIRGGGLVGNNSIGLEVRPGSAVVADRSGVTMTLDPAAGGVSNAGLLRAEAGATLLLAGGTYTQAPDGRIEVDDASSVRLEGATIRGGTIAVGTGSTLRLDSSGATFDDVALVGDSPLRVPNGTNATFLGSFHAGAPVRLESSGSFTQFIVGTDGLVLTGDGGVELLTSTARILPASSGHRLVNRSTIRGAGALGTGTLRLTNEGTIHADRATVLVVDLASSETFSNAGTLLATGTGGLTFSDSLVLNAGSVAIGDASKMAFAGTYRQVSGSTVLGDSTLTATRAEILGGTLGGAGTIPTGEPVSGKGIAATTLVGSLMQFSGVLQLGAEAVLALTVAGDEAGVGHDQVRAASAVLAGGLDLVLDPGFAATLDPARSFTILAAAGGVTGTFAGLADGATLADRGGLGTFVIRYLPGEVRLTEFTPIPEPSVGLFLVAGAALLLARRRYRR